MAVENPKIDRVSLTRVPGDEHWPDMYVVKGFITAKFELGPEGEAPAEFELKCRIPIMSDDEPLLSVEQRAADAIRSMLRILAEAT